MAFSPAAVERLFKVLGDENRLRILDALGQGERSVSEILERTRLAQTLASFHLRILREAGVLTTERRGPFIYYRLADPSLPNLLEACAKYAETVGEAKSPADFQWPPWAMMCRMVRTRRR
jgi:DNA-binding transcriptional ArsR family regulator